MDYSNPDTVVEYLMLSCAVLMTASLVPFCYGTWRAFKGHKVGDKTAFSGAVCLGLGWFCLVLAAALNVDTRMWWAIAFITFISILLLMWIARPRSWALKQQRQ